MRFRRRGPEGLRDVNATMREHLAIEQGVMDFHRHRATALFPGPDIAANHNVDRSLKHGNTGHNAYSHRTLFAYVSQPLGRRRLRPSKHQ
jgi:hypothetical protein